MRRSGLSVIVTAALLVACTGGGEVTSVADSTEAGIPDAPAFEQYQDWNLPDPMPGWGPQPVVGWIDEGETFAVVTWGSSSCPYIPTALEAAGAAALTVTLTLPASYEACTEGLGAWTHTFTLPDEVTGRPIAVTVAGDDQTGWIAGDAGLPDHTLELP